MRRAGHDRDGRIVRTDDEGAGCQRTDCHDRGHSQRDPLFLRAHACIIASVLGIFNVAIESRRDIPHTTQG